jgi:hypothetical protein
VQEANFRSSLGRAPIGNAQRVLAHVSHRLMHGSSEQAAQAEALLKGIVEHGAAAEAVSAEALASVNLNVKLPHEGCCVDAWVSSERWLFVDLTARAWFPYSRGEVGMPAIMSCAPLGALKLSGQTLLYLFQYSGHGR